MELGVFIFIALIVVGGGLWFLFWLVSGPAPDATKPQQPHRASSPQGRTAGRGKTVTLPDNLVDLRPLDSTRMRIKGVLYHVADSARRRAGDVKYVLIREPNNPHDSMAVKVVTSTGTMVGYVSAKRASLMAPLLDKIGAGGYLVSGTAATDHSIALLVDLPRVPELRKYAAGKAGQ